MRAKGLFAVFALALSLAGCPAAPPRPRPPVEPANDDNTIILTTRTPTPNPVHCAEIRGQEPAAPALAEEIVVGAVGEPVTSVMDTGHQLQLWQVLDPFARPGRWELSVRHAAGGEAGSFCLTVWTDDDKDGVPDRELARSNRKAADKEGEWSSWEFFADTASLFVGNTWEQQDERVYYEMAAAPAGYVGLGRVNYYSRRFKQPPEGQASPRFTNIRLLYLGP